ncbi:MAG: phosphoribosyltransferase family protein [Acidimicrobiales bacterium]
MAFRDRTDAGVRLAEELGRLEVDRPLVLGMARGGVPVAFEVAGRLHAPLDVIVVRKLGHPAQPELGLGALAEGGVRVVNDRLLEQLRVPEDLVDRVARQEGLELERRLAAYRGDMKAADVKGRTVIVVDDGLATGFTAMAAVVALKERGAHRVLLAVPVAPPTAVETLGTVADDVVCLEVTERFFGLSEWYDDFRQVSDDEVVELLARSALSLRSSPPAHAPPPATAPGPTVSEVDLAPAVPPADRPSGALAGQLAVPHDARGLVLFAHGSGSSRLSPRNVEVAATLQRAGLATLLFDLLTEQEASTRSNVFDIALLASRVEAAAEWVHDAGAVASAGADAGDADTVDLAALPIGLFGASTGAAAALVAAAHLGPRIAAVVSRGGRPDLAGDELSRVAAATLLIVGGDDEVVLELNRKALRHLKAEQRLVVVPGATHLFEEPGALDRVAELAAGWFVSHFGPPEPRATDLGS